MAAVMFKILFAIDVLAALTVGYFLVIGLIDGSISAFNIQLWIGIVIAIAVIIAGGMALHKSHRPILANFVLAILAVPTALYGFFIAAVVISGTPWN